MLYIIAIVCPPFATLLAGKQKQAGLTLLLTLCLWVPGIIHAFIVINEAKNKHDDLYEVEPDREKIQSYRIPRAL